MLFTLGNVIRVLPIDLATTNRYFQASEGRGEDKRHTRA